MVDGAPVVMERRAGGHPPVRLTARGVGVLERLGPVECHLLLFLRERLAVVLVQVRGEDVGVDGVGVLPVPHVADEAVHVDARVQGGTVVPVEGPGCDGLVGLPSPCRAVVRLVGGDVDRVQRHRQIVSVGLASDGVEQPRLSAHCSIFSTSEFYVIASDTRGCEFWG